MSIHLGHYLDPHREVSESCDVVLEVRSRIRKGGYNALRRVDCEFHKGVLRLSGSLPSQHLKQVAQALVLDIDKVRQVINMIDVHDVRTTARTSS